MSKRLYELGSLGAPASGGSLVGVGGANAGGRFDLDAVADYALGRLPGFVPATPALLRGTVSAHLWPGVTVGTGQAQAVRQATFAALQAALNYARDNRKFFELPPGEYQIEGAAGLVLQMPNSGGFTWRGDRASVLRQFAANAPILTVGNTGSGDGEAAGLDIDGVTLVYGVALTSADIAAIGLRIGRVWRSRFSRIVVDSEWDATRKPFLGCYIGTADANFYFSNTMEDCAFKGCYRANLYVNCNGTGNIWRNIYLSNGGLGDVGASEWGALLVDANSGALTESVWDQLNVEWTKANAPLYFNNCQAVTLSGVHIEGCQLTGADPKFFRLTNGNMVFNGLNIGGCEVLAANGVTGSPAVFHVWTPAQVAVRGFQFLGNSVDVPVRLWREQNASQDAVSYLTVDNGTIGTPGNFTFDDFLPAASYRTPYYWSRYRFGREASMVERPYIDIPAATAAYTHYGQHEDATIAIPSAPAGNVTLTLSDRLAPSGQLGANVKRRAGDRVLVRRAGPGNASTVAIVDAASSTTLVTMPASAAAYEAFAFNGTNWVRMATA